jgi:hypothetical protein
MYTVMLNYFRRFRAYNFQAENNEVKLLKEYESVTQKVVKPIELILQTAKQLQRARLS